MQLPQKYQILLVFIQQAFHMARQVKEIKEIQGTIFSVSQSQGSWSFSKKGWGKKRKVFLTVSRLKEVQQASECVVKS